MKLRTLSVSKDTITVLYIAQGMLQEDKGIKVTLSQTVQFLIHNWNHDLANTPFTEPSMFRLEEKP